MLKCNLDNIISGGQQMVQNSSKRLSSNTPVIFVSGATGVGTSTLARVILPVVGALGIVGTDTIREALRAIAKSSKKRYSNEEKDILSHSTYEVWKIFSHIKKNQEPDDSDIIRGFYLQLDLVMEATLGAAYRALSEGFPLIIEGIHISIHKLRKSTLWKNYKNRIFTVFLDCENEEVHKKHFLEDGKYFRRDTKNYLSKTNWHAIRIIGNELSNAGKKANLILESRKNPDRLVEYFGTTYFQWRISKGGDERSISYADWS